MKIGDCVKVTKIGIPHAPEYPTCLKEDWLQGVDNGLVSPFIDYWLEGYLLEVPYIGKLINVDRYNRNGVEVKGHFTSTPIKEMDEERGLFFTQNSVYQIKVLDKEAKKFPSYNDTIFMEVEVRY